MTIPSLDRAHEGLLAAEEEAAFWKAHHEEFLAKYPEQFVAVRDGTVVGVAPDLYQLIARLAVAGIEPPMVWVRFITEHPSNLLL